MYGITGPADMAAIKKAGFNCFQTYSQEPVKLAALAAEAARLELKMLAAPDKVIVSTYAAAAKGWPMLAWYLCDEPDVVICRKHETSSRAFFPDLNLFTPKKIRGNLPFPL